MTDDWLAEIHITTRADLLEFAKLAEKSERYEDVVTAITSIAKTGQDLSLEERSLLSHAYKNIAGLLRSSWRSVSNAEVNPDANDCDRRIAMATVLRLEIEKEMDELCMEVLSLVSDHLLVNSGNTEAKVFYHKMQGDYFRYLAEVSTGEHRANSIVAADVAYKSASECSETELSITHPIRLGVALNYAIFYYEIKGETEKACQLAKNTIEMALVELGQLKEDCCKDTAMIMQLLNDNLTLWTSEQSLVEDIDELECAVPHI